MSPRPDDPATVQRLQTAAENLRAANEERDQAIRDAAAAGMTRRAIAAAVGISHQRVHQIISGS